MSRPTLTVEINALRDYIERLLLAAGCGADNAKTAAAGFWEADLRGVGLQGLDHVPTVLRGLRAGRIKPDGKPRIIRQTTATALVDGDRAPGQVGANFAADLAVRKAGEAGIGVVGVTDGADLFMLGLYAERIARAAMVGLAMSDAPPLVRPHNGTERVLGTNPIAVAVPTSGEHPIVLDMATSALSASRVRQAAYHDESVPEAHGVDSQGRFSDSAAEVRAGAIGPLAEHKGFGLALCVALLSGPLTGSSTGKALSEWFSDEPGDAPSKGHLFIAIDPSSFGEREAFLEAVSAYLNEIKSSRTAPGVDAIRVPGERSAATRARTLRDGRVTLYQAVWERMAKIADELAVVVPDTN